MTTFLGVSPSDLCEWDTKPSATDRGDQGIPGVGSADPSGLQLDEAASPRDGGSGLSCIDWQEMADFVRWGVAVGRSLGCEKPYLLFLRHQ